MIDRLAFIQPEDAQVDLEKGDGQSQAPEYDSKSEFLEKYFKDVEDVKVAIHTVKMNTKKIKDLTERVGQAIGSEAEQDISVELEDVVVKTNQVCQRTKAKLDAMREENAALAKEGDRQSEIRIRNTLVTTLTHKFVEEVRTNRLAQQGYKSKVKAKVARQVRIVKPEATDEMIDEYIVGGGGSSQVIRAAIRASQDDPIAVTHLRVRDRYADVLALEKTVKELYVMYLDLSSLVSAQGEMIDQIQFQVESADEFIVQGTQQLHKAVKAQKQVRKKYCCLAFIILGIICAILLPSLLT